MATRSKPKAKPAKRASTSHKMRDIPASKKRQGERIAISTPENSPTASFWFLPYYDRQGTITPAQRIAFKSMMRHPVIKSALLQKVLAVASQDYSISLADPDNPADQANGELMRHCIDRLPMGMCGLAQTVLTPMLIDGYQAAEKVRSVEQEEPEFDGKIVYTDVKSKPTEFYDLLVDPFANVTGVMGRGPNTGLQWPISEFVFTRYLPIYDNPVGNSDFAAAYSAYWIADTVTKLRAVHAEKFVSPSVVGEFANPDDKPELEVTLEKMRSRTWAAVPAGVKISALNLAQQGESDFKSFIDDCDKKMAIAITGAYLQFLESTGNDPRGNSQVGRSVGELFQWLLAAILQEAVSKQMFTELTRWNSPGVKPPRLVLGGVDEVEIARILTNAGLLQNLGFNLSKSDISRRTSYQEADPDNPDDMLKRPVSAAVPAGTPTALPGAPGVAPTPTFP